MGNVIGVQLSKEQLSKRLSTVRDHIRLENSHDLAAVMDTFGSDAVYDDEPWDEHHRGRDAVRSFYEELFRVVPDLHIEVLQEHLSRDAVIVECVISGTHRGIWRSLPPTGRHISFPVCGIYTFSETDKLAGEKIYYDRALILRQLGVFREATSTAGRFLLLLNHPISIIGAWMRRSNARG